jgi:hypothetical protein
MKYYRTMFSLIILAFASCTDIPDFELANTIDFGQIRLADSTIKKLPYNKFPQQFIFMDSANNEYEADIRITIEIFNRFSRSYQYDNSEDQFTIMYQSQSLSTDIIIQDLDMEFTMLTSVNVYNENIFDRDYNNLKLSDYTNISVSTPLLPLSGDVSITAHRRGIENDIPETVPPMESFTINGKEYKDVYTNEGTAFGTLFDNTLIYFNYEHGIIAFKDKVSGTTYFLKE